MGVSCRYKGVKQIRYLQRPR